MPTRPCKLQDPDKVKADIDKYFEDRVKQQEVRELKNGDKRVYRKPPSIYSLSKAIGIDEDSFFRYIDDEYTEGREAYNQEICGLLRDAKRRIIDELTEGVSLGYWTEKIVLAQLAKFGVIGESDADKTVRIVIQGNNSWSE